MAISKIDIKLESKLPEPTMNKCLKNLQSLGLIKEVAHVHQKRIKHYIAAEFNPSQEVTGGPWYLNGNLDKEFINEIKVLCEKFIGNQKVATADEVNKFLKSVIKDCTSQQRSELLRSMVLDNKIIDVMSIGVGEFHSIPAGELCYKFPPDLGTGAMESIPCGICPRIRQCTNDGLISPSTCVYYTKWLDF